MFHKDTFLVKPYKEKGLFPLRTPTPAEADLLFRVRHYNVSAPSPEDLDRLDLTVLCSCPYSLWERCVRRWFTLGETLAEVDHRLAKMQKMRREMGIFLHGRMKAAPRAADPRSALQRGSDQAVRLFLGCLLQPAPKDGEP